MTLHDLTTHMSRRQRLAQEERMLEALVAVATAPTSSAPSKTPAAPGVKDKVGDLVAEIADLKTRIQFQRKQIEKEAIPIHKFIDEIDNAQVRIILLLRFIKCLSWIEIANTLRGGNTEDSVKKCCYRFLT
jgi:hypothetical protein